MLASPYTYDRSSNHKISSSGPLVGNNKPIVRLYPYSQPLPTYRPRAHLVSPRKPIEPHTLVPMTVSSTDSDSELDYPCDGVLVTPNSSCSSSDSVDTMNTNDSTASSSTSSSINNNNNSRTASALVNANHARESEEDAKFFNLLGVHPDEFQDIADLLLARRRLGGTDNRFYVERRLALFLCVAVQGLTGQAACVACRAYGLDPAALEATVHAVAEALASLDLAPLGPSDLHPRCRSSSSTGPLGGIIRDAAGALTGFHTMLDPDTDDTSEVHKRRQRHQQQQQQQQLLRQSRKSYVLIAQDLDTGLITGVSAGHLYVDTAHDVAAVFLRQPALQPPPGRFHLGTNALPMLEMKIMTPYHPSGVDGDSDLHGSNVHKDDNNKETEKFGTPEKLFNQRLAAARWPADCAREEFLERFPVLLSNQFPLETQMPLVRALAVVNNTLMFKRRYRRDGNTNR
ncbi:hypothetical protein D0Z00_001389 [Geotrichum galactomycetum]|uniref:Uncharacterized protein n=1 Tax=Geotrichum galactomycetum TaxID=27317 RepID=A0ACB6V791_9ASCO|nr:hypothetical protein D0Z00_001389 [Geotrichum candidum]